jgi:hypothetical protein
LKIGEVKNMLEKSEVYERELVKLNEIFAGVAPENVQLVEGLMHDAAFLKAENHVLRQKLAVTGMVQFHPSDPSKQRSVEASKQYLKNVNSYSVVIKALGSVLMKNIEDDDDDLSEFE